MHGQAFFLIGSTGPRLVFTVDLGRTKVHVPHQRFGLLITIRASFFDPFLQSSSYPSHLRSLSNGKKRRNQDPQAMANGVLAADTERLTVGRGNDFPTNNEGIKFREMCTCRWNRRRGTLLGRNKIINVSGLCTRCDP